MNLLKSNLSLDFGGITAGGTVTNYLQDVGGNVTNAWTGVNESLGSAFDGSLIESGAAGDFIKTLPVTQNFTLDEFFSSAIDPTSKDGTNKVLEEMTGINVWNTVESLNPANVDKEVVTERVNEFIASAERQVVAEIKKCLEGYLQELKNKNPELNIFLDLKGAILSKLGLLRRDLKFDIQNELERLLYDKIKLQQMALLRQKITEAIRKICPNHNSPPKVTRISPSLTKQLETDLSWTLVDGVKPLETNLIGASPELAYNAIQSTSTANKLVDISQTAVRELSSLSVEQATSNSDKTVNSYVGQTGKIV